MKKLFLITLFIAAAFTSSANHTRGGWMYYRYIGPGSAPNTGRYFITLKIYTECNLNVNQFCPSVNISIFNASDNSLYETVNVSYQDSLNIQNCQQQECHPCISPIPSICYKISTYEFTRDLPITSFGYVISYQRCCRIANIINMAPGSVSVGDTWTVNIPGNALTPFAPHNSSALFPQNDTAIICKDNYFSYSFGAFDLNNDSLVYEFAPAFTGPSAGGGANCSNAASPPPYNSINYIAPFSGSSPLGSSVTINAVTGLVSGIAPGTPGTYVLTVVCSEYIRGTGTKKAEVRKSLHIQVADCSLTQANLDPVYFSCDDSTMTFSNNSPGGNIQTYYWEFGDPSTGANNISSSTNPTHTYSDTGVFILKLVVNRNLPCSDSTTSLVKVYPIFAPDFTVAGQCKNTPIQFTDVSTTTIGVVDYWHWNFGDAGSASNISFIQNPTHTYAASANYDVQFIVANSKGCKDTVYKTVIIADKPALEVTNDTLICYIDTLQLNAIGTGTFIWSPNYNIDNTAAQSPLVSPDVPTKYYVTLTDPYGCVGSDSVFVDVKLLVTLQAGNDSTICKTDAVVLQLNSDALHHLWTPPGTLNDPTLKNPTATPTGTLTYQVVGNIGKCTASDDITLKVVPYPTANAGTDTAICVGTSAQLNASGGTNYSWSPAAFLTAANIANPIAVNPTANVKYIVTVRDTLGCPKTAKDTVIVLVTKINADAGPRDTTVVIDQPLLLRASGGTNYLWSPAQWLNNIGTASPVALPQSNIEYIVKVSNAAGCFAYDSILVKVFKLDAGFYVPTAFSPNGDGRNDLFRPVLLGMKGLDLFKVFNRWGQMLYSSTDFESGWDGKFGGREQASATYIWYAEGTDYKNNKIKKKGYVVLVR